MPYKISLRPKAVQDIDDIYDSREVYRSGSGTSFLEDLSDLMIQLQEFPFSAPRIDGALRRGVTSKTRHNVYYEVLDQTVEILYIIHGSQDY